MASEAKSELKARLDALGKRIEEHRHHSAAESGVPYGASQWKDIVETHGRLVSHIADERRDDAASMEHVRADLEALSLSLENWIKGIDRHFAGKRGGE